MEFEQFGYYKEYYVNNKFIGKITAEKDRDEIGYSGRKKERIETDIVLGNRKKIKAGTEAMTILYPLCGKIIP